MDENKPSDQNNPENPDPQENIPQAPEPVLPQEVVPVPGSEATTANTEAKPQIPLGSTPNIPANIASGNASAGFTPPSIPPPTDVSQTVPVTETPPTKKPNMLLAVLVVLFAGFLMGILVSVTGFLKTGPNLRLGESDSREPVAATAPVENFRVGTDATYPPMEFKDNKGTLIGYDIDLARIVAEELGTQAEYKDIPFDDLFAALEQGEVDVLISSVTITDERKTKYDFSEPYFNAGQVIVTEKNASDSLLTPASLKNKKVGVQKGTTSEAEALKYVSSSLVTSFDNYNLAVLALQNKKIDVVVVDLTAAKGLVDNNQNLRISSEPFTNEYYGIVMKKGNTVMMEKLNKILLSLRERGILANIQQKWFR